MSVDEKKLRKFFLEAFDQTVMPRLDSIDEEISSINKRMDDRFDAMDIRFDAMDIRFEKIDKELLDLKEFTIPRIIELQENSKFIAKEVSELAKGGARKRTAQEIRGLEKLISRLKKELSGVNARIAKFETKLREIQQSKKRKIAK